MKRIVFALIVSLLAFDTAASPKSKAECDAVHGEWMLPGMAPIGHEICRAPTRDAGKACSDSSECEGSCEWVERTGWMAHLSFLPDKGVCASMTNTEGGTSLVHGKRVEIPVP